MPHTPITREEVAQAVVSGLRKEGVQENQLPHPDDVELPAVVSAPANRTLQAASICWDSNSGRMQCRLECRGSGECVPFFVHVRMAQSALTACRLVSRPARLSPHRPIVRPGDRARVVFLGNRLHLASAVTCLERGAEGDIIRVRNQDGNIFRARVSGPGLLEAVPQ